MEIKTFGIFYRDLGHMQMQGKLGLSSGRVCLVTARPAGTDIGLGGYRLGGLLRCKGKTVELEIFDEAKKEEWGLIGFHQIFRDAFEIYGSDLVLDSLSEGGAWTEPALQEGSVLYFHSYRESEAAEMARERKVRATKQDGRRNWPALGRLQEAA